MEDTNNGNCTSNSNLRNELEMRPVVILFAKNMNEYSTFKSKFMFISDRGADHYQ